MKYDINELIEKSKTIIKNTNVIEELNSLRQLFYSLTTLYNNNGKSERFNSFKLILTSLNKYNFNTEEMLSKEKNIDIVNKVIEISNKYNEIKKEIPDLYDLCYFICNEGKIKKLEWSMTNFDSLPTVLSLFEDKLPLYLREEEITKQLINKISMFEFEKVVLYTQNITESEAFNLEKNIYEKSLLITKKSGADSQTMENILSYKETKNILTLIRNLLKKEKNGSINKKVIFKIFNNLILRDKFELVNTNLNFEFNSIIKKLNNLGYEKSSTNIEPKIFDILKNKSDNEKCSNAIFNLLNYKEKDRTEVSFKIIKKILKVLAHNEKTPVYFDKEIILNFKSSVENFINNIEDKEILAKINGVYIKNNLDFLSKETLSKLSSIDPNFSIDEKIVKEILNNKDIKLNF